MVISDLYKEKRRNLKSLMRLRKQGVTGGEKICPSCHESILKSELKQKALVCPNCRHYFTMKPRERIKLLADEGSFREIAKGLRTVNPLQFPDYEKRLVENRTKSGNDDAIVTGTIEIGGIPVALGVMDASFMMGSMGTVVGERVARITEYAMKKKLPLILVCASGGARMQEGMFSLLQMAKTAAVIERFQEKGGLYISVLTNPTTGGVSASFASLGDIIIAEPNALICFAGPRVIEQTIGEKLPEGFQRAEFFQEHGMLDMVVEREKLKNTIYRILKMHQRAGKN